ncbi:MAG: 3-ketoacyl-ACP reductase [Synergistaceae bacterium]|nr:3-ketoacyl-ACP reductase [Synergistaceae bacterium]
MRTVRKVILVTGSSRGIGLGVLKKHGELGYSAVMSSSSGIERAAGALEELKALGVDASYVKCDVSRPEDRQAALDFVLGQYGRVDVLVNNAGVAPLKRMNILETTEDSFDRLMDINLKGTFFMCQLFANAMISLKEKGLPDYSPRIINIGSLSAYTASVNRGEYCISKAGIAMVTSLFAAELAGRGIPVFEIRPGIIKTDMTRTVEARYDKFIFEEDGVPAKRWGLPEDIGNAAAALSEGAFDYSPGQVINVDGGFHIRRL